MDNAQLAVKVEQIGERQDRLEERQDKLEDLHRTHREEFAETRTYTKESYRQLERIAQSITALEKTTNDRIEQQTRYYREELKDIQKDIQALQQRPQSPPPAPTIIAPAPASIQPDKKDGPNKEILDFTWKVIAGVFALATAILGILQATGGKLPGK